MDLRVYFLLSPSAFKNDLRNIRNDSFMDLPCIPSANRASRSLASQGSQSIPESPRASQSSPEIPKPFQSSQTTTKAKTLKKPRMDLRV